MYRTRYYNPESEILLLLAILIAACMGIYSYFRARRRKKRPDPVRITKSFLLRTCIWPHVRLYLLWTVLLGALMLLACIAGRMTLLAAAAGIAVVCLFLALCAYPSFSVQYRPLKYILELPESNSIYQGRYLQPHDNAWLYIDEQWFIRISSSECAALHAPEIDFQHPVRSYQFLFPSTVV